MSETIQVQFAELQTDWESPEQMIAHLAQQGPDEYDILAAQTAFRRRIIDVLPEHWTLSGSTFIGPWEGYPEGVAPYHYSPADFAPLGDARNLLARPVGDDSAYYQDLIEPYKTGQDTTRVMYGTWQQAVGDPLRIAAQEAIDAWAFAHVEDLADSGRYDEETLYRAVGRRFATPEQAEQVADAFREEFNAAMPEGLTIGAHDDFYGPYPRRTIDIRRAVRRTDLTAIAVRCLDLPAREVLTAEQVADEIGLSSAAAARKTLSRWGVQAVRSQPSAAGRLQAVYDAGQVREAMAHRPGRGARTDLT